MAKSFVIVEHDSDKFTFEAILRFMKKEAEIEVGSSEESDIQWHIRSAESSIEQPTGLKESLLSVFKEIKKGKYEKVAIIWDMDTFTESERIAQMNNAIHLAIGEYMPDNQGIVIDFAKAISKANDFENIVIDGNTAQIACHFINFGGSGELENLLKAIKAKDSNIADCIDAKMPECLAENDEKALRDKDLVKLWMNHYQRYDTLEKKKRNDAFTRWENVMLYRSDIFDFGNTDVKELLELKDFLKNL